MSKFSGIFPALLTPFDDNGKINYSALSDLLEYDISKGVTGFYVSGSSGEAFVLTFEERKELFSAVAKICKGRCTLIGQVGCISTEQSLELALHCEKEGYDAVSSVAPFYYKFGFGEIKNYYNTIVENTTLPMLIYNIPALTGIGFTAEQFDCFLDNDRYLGVKFTSSDFFTLERIRTAHPERIIYNGYDEIMLSGLIAGADGGIGTTYNFMPEKFIGIYKLFNEGKIAEARALQTEANTVIDALIKVGVLPGSKYLLGKLGIGMGNCRPPFKTLSDDDKKLLDSVFPLISE